MRQTTALKAISVTPPALAHHDLDAFFHESFAALFLKLGPQQAEVMNHLALGMQNKVIASRMQISLSTVKTHITTLYLKTMVTNRVQLALNWLVYVEAIEWIGQSSAWPRTTPRSARFESREKIRALCGHSHAFDVLSPQERVVADYVARGFSTKKIALLKNVSPATVKAQIGQLYAKTNMRDRLSLSLWWLSGCGLIKAAPPEQGHAPSLHVV